MYAGSPTIFNVPEITTLRRVKPLPKRRRTSAPSSTGTLVPVIPSPLSAAAAAAAAVVASTGSLIGDPELEAAANALLASPLPPPPLPPQPQGIMGAGLRSQPNSPRLQSQSQSQSLSPASIHGHGNISNLNASNSGIVSLDPPDTFGLGALPPLPPLPGLPPDPTSCSDTTAEELLAHADTLSARMALQSYYMPMLGSVHEFLAAAAASAGISAGEMFKDRLGGVVADGANGGMANGGYVDLDSGVGSMDLMYGAGGTGGGYHGMNGLAGMGMGIGMGIGMGVGIGMGMGNGRDEDDEVQGDGDYIDHLQQPGNTKKRKVPANASVSQRDEVESSDHMQDEGEERGVPMGRVVDCDDLETSPVERYMSGGAGYHHPHPHQLSPHASLVPTMYHGWRRGKLTAATLAGLQHKELLKTRKRQLAAVLGALSHGDTLALDQALSVSYPFGDVKNTEPKIRLSKRRVVRMARMMKKENKEGVGSKLPGCEFTFSCPSATADRLIATKEEVAMLRRRFEEELARQATKTEQLAAAENKVSSGPESAMALSGPTSATVTTTTKGTKGKKSQRVKAPKGEQPTAVADSPVDSQQPPSTVSTPVKTRGKKKKRSALANASNPHHLRNYVPSRLPNSGAYGGGPNAANQQQQQNWVSPLPVRFLTAEIPRRRKQKGGGPEPQPTTQAPLTNPADEWICAFCEYDLFYGDELRYRRAVRNRKKILRRRRRAKERAAAAASGRTNSSVAPASAAVPAPPPAPGAVPGVSSESESTIVGRKSEQAYG